MKYLIAAILLAMSFTASAQPTVNGRGEANTPTDQRLMVVRNLFTPVYQDTTAANLDLGIDSSGALIWTRVPKSLWVREYNTDGAKYWELYGTGSTPPAGSNRAIQWNDAGAMGASDAFKYTTSGYLDLSYGGLTMLLGADNSATTRTNATSKSSIFALPHYTTTEENVVLFIAQSFSGTNSLNIGYGNASYNAMTELRFGVGATATSTTGVEKLRLTNTGLYVGTGANPSAKLHIEAGTTTIAPLRFTSGTNKTTAAAGEMEYDGTNLYFTPTGTTRKRLVITNNATPSNGQIPIGNGTDYTAANITSTDGSITVTNGAGSIDLSIPTTTLISGTYTPTLTANASGGSVLNSATLRKAYYQRVGNIVEVSVYFEIDVATPSTDSKVDISLPIASSLSNIYEVIGFGYLTNVSSDSGNGGSSADEMNVNANTTDDRARVGLTTMVNTGTQFCKVKFSYEIL